MHFSGGAGNGPGGRGTPWGGWGANRRQEVVEGEVLESAPPRLLRHTWRALYDLETASEPYSRVSWELEQAGEGVTKLTVVHDELEHSPKTAESVAGGWPYVVSGLKSVVETGEGLGV